MSGNGSRIVKFNWLLGDEEVQKYISYDLGTGGVKASLFDEDMQTLAKSFIEYDTYYPEKNMHEQKPEDWWNGVVLCTQKLLKDSQTTPREIVSLAVSGHSLVTVPVGYDGAALSEYVPIWSDTRADKEVEEFFEKIDEMDWYKTTGNGFPAPCYSLFKLMWMKKYETETFRRIKKVLGSKDYINYRLTGEMYTDYSYASGMGAYHLLEGRLENRFLDAAGISKEIFPQIVSSHFVLGNISAEAAEIIGLSENTKVACGGVDNACMALGAVGSGEGAVYTSLGSSGWIAVNSSKPVLDEGKRPYVFAHIQEGMFTSAYSIFAGGSSLRWVRDNLCMDLLEQEEPYSAMTKEAENVPAGSNGVYFNPSLAGGTSQDNSIHIQGAYIGLHLGTTRAHLVHASMEGIAMNLKRSYDSLKSQTEMMQQLQFCGGGSKNQYWMQMFADVFNTNILKTNIDQDAASIGAAAIAARACGAWDDYTKIYKLHHTEFVCSPRPKEVEAYQKIIPIFRHICDVLSELGDYMKD